MKENKEVCGEHRLGVGEVLNERSLESYLNGYRWKFAGRFGEGLD